MKRKTYTRESLLQLMQAHDYDMERAARADGTVPSTLYQRLRRVGLSVVELEVLRRTDAVPAPQAAIVPATPPAGDAVLEDGSVTLAMADYALLQHGSHGHVRWLEGELDRANRIIATLTRQVADLARSAGARAAVVLLGLLLSAGPAAAQTDFHGEPVVAVHLPFTYTLVQRAYAPNERATAEYVAAKCPDLVRERHPHRYVDALATLLRQRDANWGRNGKRGNAGDPSDDALFYRTSASPFGGAVIDVVFAAGDPTRAAATWIDQTDATIAAGTTGVMVEPSGVLPPCLSGAGVPPDPQPPPVVVDPGAPIPIDDAARILAALARIDARLAALEAREPVVGPFDPALLTTYIDAMIGNGPGDGAPNHITDILQRIDAIRAEQSWLRGRAVLRY